MNKTSTGLYWVSLNFTSAFKDYQILQSYQNCNKNFMTKSQEIACPKTKSSFQNFPELIRSHPLLGSRLWLSIMPFSHSKTLFTRYWIHVVTTSISASLRSYLLSPFLLWLAVIKFCNIIVNLRANSSRNYLIWCRHHADPVPCKRGLRPRLHGTGPAWSRYQIE